MASFVRGPGDGRGGQAPATCYMQPESSLPPAPYGLVGKDLLHLEMGEAGEDPGFDSGWVGRGRLVGIGGASGSGVSWFAPCMIVLCGFVDILYHLRDIITEVLPTVSMVHGSR